MNNKTVKLYNIVLPFWLLISFPSLLWLILIPVNFIIDGLVLWCCKKKLQIEYENFLKKYTWKVCLIGFLSDFLGAMLLFVTLIVFNEFNTAFANALSNALAFNCFTNIFALLITFAAIFAAGTSIYFFNLRLFKNKLDTQAAKHIALWLAVITAPYLFLLPTSLFFS